MLGDFTFFSTCVALACLFAASRASVRPYSYVVQYSRAFKDQRERPTPRHITRPRLVVEEVRKTVEIRIEEGYERGGYDHRHYQTLNKTWNEYQNGDYNSDEDDDDKEAGGKTRNLPLTSLVLDTSTSPPQPSPHRTPRPCPSNNGKRRVPSSSRRRGEALREGGSGAPAHFVLPRLVQKNALFSLTAPVTTFRPPSPLPSTSTAPKPARPHFHNNTTTAPLSARPPHHAGALTSPSQ